MAPSSVGGVDIHIRLTKEGLEAAWVTYRSLIEARTEAGLDPTLAAPLFIATLNEAGSGDQATYVDRISHLLYVAVEHAWICQVLASKFPDLDDALRPQMIQLGITQMIDGIESGLG